MSQYELELKFNEWINAKSDEGFSALHLAAFRGNIV